MFDITYGKKNKNKKTTIQNIFGKIKKHTLHQF